MFGRHATTFALPDPCAAPLRWQQPGASTSGRLGDRQSGPWMPTHAQTCRGPRQPRLRTLRIQAATGEATSTSAAARQKVLDSVRESLARRAAGSGAGQRAGGKAASRQASARPRAQGGGKPGGGKPSGGKPSSIAQPFQGSAPVTLRRPPSGDATAGGQRLSKVRPG